MCLCTHACVYVLLSAWLVNVCAAGRKWGPSARQPGSHQRGAGWVAAASRLTAEHGHDSWGGDWVSRMSHHSLHAPQFCRTIRKPPFPSPSLPHQLSYPQHSLFHLPFSLPSLPCMFVYVCPLHYFHLFTGTVWGLSERAICYYFRAPIQLNWPKPYCLVLFDTKQGFIRNANWHQLGMKCSLTAVGLCVKCSWTAEGISVKWSLCVKCLLTLCGICAKCSLTAVGIIMCEMFIDRRGALFEMFINNRWDLYEMFIDSR